MKRNYIKFDKAVEMLKSGFEIYTDRGFGGSPYNPLFFRLYKGKICGGEIHHATIKSLINKGVINGVNKNGNKYSLI